MNGLIRNVIEALTTLLIDKAAQERKEKEKQKPSMAGDFFAIILLLIGFCLLPLLAAVFASAK